MGAGSSRRATAGRPRWIGPWTVPRTDPVLGPPSFTPPEPAAGRRRAIRPASDVYSRSAILHHLVTGRPPFVAERLADLLRLLAEAEPESLRTGAIFNGGVTALENFCRNG